jgi:hypothetical protein
MPFAWARRSAPLSDPEAFGELRTLIAETARGMQERFGLPLALVIIDALMPVAQFKDADKRPRRGKSWTCWRRLGASSMCW